MSGLPPRGAESAGSLLVKPPRRDWGTFGVVMLYRLPAYGEQGNNGSLYAPDRPVTSRYRLPVWTLRTWAMLSG